MKAKTEDRAADFVATIVVPLALLAVAYFVYRYHPSRE